MSLSAYFSRKFQYFHKAGIDNFLEDCQSRLRYTPDVAPLTRRAKQLVFLYDEFMRSHPMHNDHIKPHGQFQATAFTVHKYSVWKKKLGKHSFPVALDHAYTGASKAPVKGELFSIDTEQLFELDKHKENMSQFRRTRVSVSIPHRVWYFLKERIELHGVAGTEPAIISEIWLPQVGVVNAWMYVGKYDYWHPQLDAGYLFSPITRYFNLRQRVEYYYFNTMEYDE